MIDFRLGDCLATDGLHGIANLSVDVTITDPPFDERTHRAALEGPCRGGKRTVAGELPFAALSDAAIRELAAHLARVTRRWILVFCADRQIETWAQALEDGGARFVRVGLALRTNPRPQLSGDRPAPPCDPIVIAHGGAGAMRWNGGGRAARWNSPAARHDEGGQVHPTQKPLALMRALLEDFSEPGELVLDPFAGSGTTAVVCRELGRHFLGWELSPDYHAAALARVEAAREQLRLELAPAEQRGLAL